MKQIGKTSNNFSQIKIKKIFNQKKSYWRKIMNALKNKDFTIISHNCVGGVIYHDLGLKFNTPTINLFFMAKDFIKFCNNLIHYLNCEMEPFNHEKYVAHFINSLRSQTYENWELIIIDDCSTDGNVKEIKKFNDKRIKFFEQPFKHIIIVRNKRNKQIRFFILRQTPLYLHTNASDNPLLYN